MASGGRRRRDTQGIVTVTVLTTGHQSTIYSEAATVLRLTQADSEPDYRRVIVTSTDSDGPSKLNLKVVLLCSIKALFLSQLQSEQGIHEF